VFSLPINGSPKPNTKLVRVYNNTSTGNNHENFAAPGSVVGQVPVGMGMLIMAADQVEAFGNHIENSGTAQTAIVSYLVLVSAWMRSNLPTYPIYPSNVWIHDTTFVSGTATPDPGNPLGIIVGTTWPTNNVPTMMPSGLPGSGVAVPDTK